MKDLSFLVYGMVAALALLVVLGVSVAVRMFWRRKTSGTATAPTMSRLSVRTNPVVRQIGVVLLVAVVLWVVGSLVNHKIDNPMPYTIALALGALQFFTGTKKGNLKSAVLLTVLAVVVIWFWIHPQVLWGIGSSIIEPLGTSETVRSWGRSDVSLALNVIMLAIIARALWWTGDFYGMLLQVTVMIIARMLFGI